MLGEGRGGAQGYSSDPGLSLALEAELAECGEGRAECRGLDLASGSGVLRFLILFLEGKKEPVLYDSTFTGN